MEFLDKLSETIVSAGKDVGQKAKDCLLYTSDAADEL